MRCLLCDPPSPHGHLILDHLADVHGVTPETTGDGGVVVVDATRPSGPAWRRWLGLYLS